MSDIVLNQSLLDAQIAVLGSLMIDSGKVADALTRLAEEDFTEPRYLAIYQAIKHLFGEGQPVDAVTVNAKLGGESGKLIGDILTVTPTAANCDAYIDVLKRSALLYHLQEIGQQISESRDADDCQKLVDKANQLFVGRPGIKTMTMMQGYDSFFDRHNGTDKPDLIDWGVMDLNSRIFVERGDMVVIGGYPSDGKTALALAFAMTIGKTKRVGYFTYEGSREKLHDRIMAAQAMLSMSDLKQNKLSEADYDTVVALYDKLTAPNVMLIEASKLTVMDIQAFSQAHHFDIVFVDYLQKVASERGRRNMSDFERVSAISSDLQQFARSTGTVLVALSQLTRPEKKKDGTIPAPTMQSLRQSGQIEQDADVVLLLYSENPNDKNSLRVVKIGKNKEGERNDAFRVRFDGAHQTFGAFSSRPEPSDTTSRAPSTQVSFTELGMSTARTPWEKEGA